MRFRGKKISVDMVRIEFGSVWAHRRRRSNLNMEPRMSEAIVIPGLHSTRDMIHTLTAKALPFEYRRYFPDHFIAGFIASVSIASITILSRTFVSYAAVLSIFFGVDPHHMRHRWLQKSSDATLGVL